MSPTRIDESLADSALSSNLTPSRWEVDELIVTSDDPYVRDLLRSIENNPRFKEWTEKLRQNDRSAGKRFDFSIAGIYIELQIFSFFMTAGTKRMTVKLAVDEADGKQLSEWVKDGLIGEIRPS